MEIEELEIKDTIPNHKMSTLFYKNNSSLQIYSACRLPSLAQQTSILFYTQH